MMFKNVYPDLSFSRAVFHIAPTPSPSPPILFFGYPKVFTDIQKFLGDSGNW
jgi:hypothetical protein